MDKKISKYLEKLKKGKKKRFNLIDLENHIIDGFGGNSRYMENGGYIFFAKEINKLKLQGQIKEIKSSDYNGLNPPLKLKWEIIVGENEDTWDKFKLLRLSNLLDFTYYVNNPIYQTELEWEYIENIYDFLKKKDSKEWASVEERSLELFYDEKFLTERKETMKGKYGILKRLKLSYEDLKMKKYGEMFVYWNKATQDIRTVIILENHSTFFTYKRIAENGGNIFGVLPDILIYGEGNKIEKSFSFIEEIADINKIKVLYFGDIDSEGFGIYNRLKERYPGTDIRLQKEAYVHLINICSRDYPKKSQIKNPYYLECFIKEMGDHLDLCLRKKLDHIWDNDYRIPQELLNYEYLLKVME